MGEDKTALVDSGYITHQHQTLALVQHALGDRPLDLLLNTHLHSDHCGGNSILQQTYPEIETWVSQAQFDSVKYWRTSELSFDATGQSCEQFTCHHALIDGSSIRLGHHLWQIHAAPGHDPDSVILFQPDYRCLISADALWEQGFGVVFPELTDESGFLEVGQSLDLIESLQPLSVIPGHGRVFQDVRQSLQFARARLAAFRQDGSRHAKHAAKVLLKFKLMEMQRERKDVFIGWAVNTQLVKSTIAKFFPDTRPETYVGMLIQELCRSGVLSIEGEEVLDSE